MEPILLISNLNDFVFCPYSIYLHQVYGALDGDLYYEKVQIDGKNSHESIDNATHDTNAHVLLGTSIYSNKYGLMGKIDMFDSKKMRLTERKNQIKQIYDGYLLQLYAQYFCLIEMGFEVKSMGFHSLKDNRPFPIDIPNVQQTHWFENYLDKIRAYDPSQALTKINPNKCKFCIYSALCEQHNLDTTLE